VRSYVLFQGVRLIYTEFSELFTDVGTSRMSVCSWKVVMSGSTGVNWSL